MKAVKRISLLVILVSSMLVINSYKFLQTDEDGPHGGKVKVSGKYHIEMKNQEDAFYTFLLDKDMSPIKNSFVSGSVRFFYNDETSQEIKLKKFQEDGFYTETPVPDFLSCKVTFSIYGKHVWANFDNITLIVKKGKN